MFDQKTTKEGKREGKVISKEYLYLLCQKGHVVNFLYQDNQRKFTVITNPVGNNHISPSKISSNISILPILNTQATHNNIC